MFPWHAILIFFAVVCASLWCELVNYLILFNTSNFKGERKPRACTLNPWSYLLLQLLLIKHAWSKHTKNGTAKDAYRKQYKQSVLHNPADIITVAYITSSFENLAALKSELATSEQAANDAKKQAKRGARVAKVKLSAKLYGYRMWQMVRVMRVYMCHEMCVSLACACDCPYVLASGQ